MSESYCVAEHSLVKKTDVLLATWPNFHVVTAPGCRERITVARGGYTLKFVIYLYV